MFDTHAHVAFESFDGDRDEVIARAKEAGVTGWIEVGTDLAQSKKAIALAQQESQAYASVGVHPSDIAELTPAVWTELEQLLGQPKVVAVGEVGLDFYRGGQASEQLPVLARFVEIALARNLPVIFHVRDAASDQASRQATAHDSIINFLQSLPPENRPRGVMHTFSGNAQQAQAYLALGMYLSFSGVVTFKNAQATADIARTMPLDRLLIETDCPFLAPEPYRGKRNEPAYVKLVAEKIASLRQMEVSALQEATTRNTRTLFSV